MDEPPILADGTLDPLALIVMADTMPGAVAEKLGPQHRHGWFGPSVDLTFHLRPGRRRHGRGHRHRGRRRCRRGAPVVIFGDADLPAAASALRAAGYWNSGQECGAACRVLVHESVAEHFTALLVDEVGTLQVGEAGAGEGVEIGPLVSQAHFDRVTATSSGPRRRASGRRPSPTRTRR